MLNHFRQRGGFRHGATWEQHRNRDVVRLRCDYILGSDRRLFTVVSVRDRRQYASDHYCMVEDLRSSPLVYNKRYLKGRKTSPLQPQKWGPKTLADTMFKAVKDLVAKTRPKKRYQAPWVSQTTWELVDQRAWMLKVSDYDRVEAQWLNCAIKQAFKADRKTSRRRGSTRRMGSGKSMVPPCRRQTL